MTDIELLERAASLLDSEALHMRHRHFVDHVIRDWKGETEAQRVHDEMKDTATRLYEMANRLETK